MEAVNPSLVTTQVIILFLTMFAGVYARKREIIDWKTTKILSSFLVNVTNPLLIIASFQIEYDEQKLVTGLWIVLLSMVTHLITAALAFLFFRPVRKPDARAIYQFGLIFGNCGFIGFPVLRAIFGEIGLFYGAFYVAFFNIFVWTYGVFLMCREKKNGHQLSWKKIFLNAGTVSTVVGILLFVLPFRMPEVALSAVNLVGDMTFPLSMIIIGSLIAGIRIKDLFRPASLFSFSAIRLLVLPVVMTCVCALCHFPFVYSYIGIVMCAMPSATNTAIFSEIYDCDSALAAKCVGVTTLFSLVTIPVILYFANFLLG